jgi:hypothetical protein
MIPALAVAAVALAIRLLVAEYLPLIDPDGVVYVSIAKQVHASGSPFDPLYHPLYPICIALAEPLVGEWETTGRSALRGGRCALGLRDAHRRATRVALIRGAGPPGRIGPGAVDVPARLPA